MNKTTESLLARIEKLEAAAKLAKKALTYLWDQEGAERAFAAIREALSEPVNTRRCSEYSEVEYSEHVKQEPVAKVTDVFPTRVEWLREVAVNSLLYAAPVQPVQEPVAWQKQVDEICLKATEIRFAKTDDKAQAVIDDIRAILETTPPSTSLAARQMRDAASALNRKWAMGNHDGLMAVADLIDALPVPEVQWRNLTDDELKAFHHIEEFGLFCDADEFIDIARAVIAAFKDKNK